MVMFMGVVCIISNFVLQYFVTMLNIYFRLAWYPLVHFATDVNKIQKNNMGQLTIMCKRKNNTNL